MRQETFARALVATMTATTLMSNLAHAQPSDAGKSEASRAVSASAVGMMNAILEIKPCVVLIETETAEGTSYGTGFIISADGHILTNDHVVRGAQAVTVYYLNKEKFRAQIVKSAPRTTWRY